jgi:hypothetical protein
MKTARSFSCLLVVLATGCGTSSTSPDSASSVDAPSDVPAANDVAVSLADAPGAETGAPDQAVAPEDAATDGLAAPVPDAGDAGSLVGPGLDGPRAASRALDLLFMIDNSPSMQEEQANLIRNFPALMNELKNLPGGLPDLHVAVVTSDLGAGSVPLSNGGCPRIGGDRGIFQSKVECGLDGNAKFMVTLNNGTMNNFQGDPSKVFSCMAQVGTFGCGYEHQLQATRVALYEAITPENKGFLRDDAMLGIVLISDEDDCSAETRTNLFVDDASFPGTTASFRCAPAGHLCDGKQPPVAAFDVPLETCTASDMGRLIRVQDVVDSIKTLKRRPAEQIVVAGIFGWPNSATGARYRYVQTREGLDYAPVCQSANGQATAALRLKNFVESFGTGGAFFSICNDDFSPAMKQIGARLAGRF